MLVEWPIGSGLVADYDDFELALMREMRPRIPNHEITFLHEMKRVFGARLRPYTTSGGRSTMSALFPADTPVNHQEGMFK